jgi:hypothetical protein
LEVCKWKILVQQEKSQSTKRLAAQMPSAFLRAGCLEEKLQQLLLSFADYVIFEKDDQYKVYAMTGYTATISDGSTPVPEGVPYVAAEYSPNF